MMLGHNFFRFEGRLRQKLNVLTLLFGFPIILTYSNQNFSNIIMRVQLSPHIPTNNRAISGYRVSPQHNTLSLTHKSTAALRVNYEEVLDDGKDLTEPFTPNLLPINFCNTPGEYNRLLITNGKKILSEYSKTQGSGAGVPTVEFLNIPVFKRNQEKQERIKEIYRIKEEQKRQKSTAVELPECNCCCCDNFCKVCNDEMHANFDHQPIQSHVPRVGSVLSRAKSERATRSPVRRVIKIEPEPEQWVNKSQKSRKQRLMKKRQNQDLLEEPEEYQRIRPLLQRSMEKQRVLEYNRLVNDPKMVAYTKMERAKQYDQKRRMNSHDSLQKSTKPKLPWNYNIAKQKTEVDKYCHKHSEPKGFIYRKPLPKEEEDNALCHPVGLYNKQQIQIARKYLGDRAQNKLEKEKDAKIQEKIKVTNNLRRLEEERREIIEKTTKQRFKPSKTDIEKAFNLKEQK